MMSTPHSAKTPVWIAAILAFGAHAVGAAEPKPDDKLIKPAAASLPIKYKADGIAVSAEYSLSAFVVCTIPKAFSKEFAFEVYEPKTCKRTGNFQVGGKKPIQTMAINPGGTRLAILEGSEDTILEVSVWTVPEGKELRKRWSPANSTEALDTRVIGIAFVADDKLSLTQGGRVACWTMADEKPAFDVQVLDAEKKQRFLSHGPRMPANFGFSPDRAILAVQQNDGMTLVDTATGRTTGQLPAPKDTARFRTIDGLAFSPDGKKLAACYTFAAGPDSKTPRLDDKRIVVWDIAAKRVDVEAPLLTHVNSGSQGSWWGDGHLIWHYGGGQNLVLRADTGAIIRDCLPPYEGATTASILVGGVSDGQLRYLTNAFTTNFLAYDAPTEHLKTDAAVDDGKGFYKRLWLTKEGVEKMPADVIATKRKFEIPKR